MANLVRNLKNSLSGLRAALSDRSFRAELMLGVVLTPIVATSSALTSLKLTILGTYFFLLAIELINTALEKLCDRVTLEHDLAIKSVKDMASAAVMLTLVVLLCEVALAFVGLPEF